MKNFIQPGNTMTVAAPADVSSGDLVMVGKLFGVASTDAVSGAPVEICTEGVYTLPKISAQAWTQGIALYWDAGEGKVTSTASTNTLIGHAAEIAANPSSTGVLRLSI